MADICIFNFTNTWNCLHCYILILSICLSLPSVLGPQYRSLVLSPLMSYLPSKCLYLFFFIIIISVVESIFDEAVMLWWNCQMETLNKLEGDHLCNLTNDLTKIKQHQVHFKENDYKVL